MYPVHVGRAGCIATNWVTTGRQSLLRTSMYIGTFSLNHPYISSSGIADATLFY